MIKFITVLVLSLIIYSQRIYSQDFALDKNKAAFLLGTLNDDGSRRVVFKHPIQAHLITILDSRVNHSEIFLDSLKLYLGGDKACLDIKVESISPYDATSNIDNYTLTRIYSKKYSRYFNSYFKFRKLTGSGYFDEKDGIDSKTYNFYIGTLKVNKLKTIDEKLQFIAGSFLARGKRKTNGDYVFSFANSISKCNIIKSFLLETKSEILSTEVKPENIPVPCIITFIPNPTLKILLDDYVKVSEE